MKADRAVQAKPKPHIEVLSDYKEVLVLALRMRKSFPFKKVIYARLASPTNAAFGFFYLYSGSEDDQYWYYYLNIFLVGRVIQATSIFKAMIYVLSKKTDFTFGFTEYFPKNICAELITLAC